MAQTQDTGRLDSGIFHSGGTGLRRPAAPHWAEVNTVRALFRRHPWLINLVLGILLLYVLDSIFSQSTAPVVVRSAEAMSRTAPAGGEVQIKFVVDRREICENSIMSYWTDSRGVEVMRLAVRSRTVPKTGNNLPVFITVAVPVVTGQMCYRSTVIHRCNGGDYPVSTPPVCIQVTPS